MPYTVKKLSKLSGVSVRTLHWYDKIGLLKPAYYGDNNYRYYEEEQLLMLQRILFFRGLGFQLDTIKKILAHDDLDNSKSLSEHKNSLKKKISQFEQFVNIINCTLEHLKKTK